MSKMMLSSKEEAKRRKERAKEMMKSSPPWLRSFIKAYKLNPETVQINIDTPVYSKMTDIPGVVMQEHTGEISITISGYKKR